MEKIPGWVEKIFTPKVNELIGEVKALNTKVDSFRNVLINNETSVLHTSCDDIIPTVENSLSNPQAGLNHQISEWVKGLSGPHQPFNTWLYSPERIIYFQHFNIFKIIFVPRHEAAK